MSTAGVGFGARRGLTVKRLGFRGLESKSLGFRGVVSEHTPCAKGMFSAE